MVKHPNLSLAIIALCLIALPTEAEAPALLLDDSSLRCPVDLGVPPPLGPDLAGRFLADTVTPLGPAPGLLMGVS